MTLSGYVELIRRWWWTLLIAAWVAAVAGWLVANQLPKVYESRTLLLVGPINTDANTLRASGQLVQTYATIATTEPLLTSAIAETGLDGIDPLELAAQTRATANDVTRFLTIRVQADDPERASLLANAVATEMIQLASRGISRPEGEIQVVDFARPIPTPVAPQVSLLVMLAAAAGLVAAAVLVMLIEYLTDSVRGREDLRRVTEAPFLGSITGRGDPIPRPTTPAGQGYRLLAAKLLPHVDEGRRSVLTLDTTSAATSAIVAANVASMAARLGKRVILIDGDGRDGPLTRMFRLSGLAGTMDVLAGTARTADVLREVDRITLVGGGRTSLESLDVERCRAFLAELAAFADLVIVSAAPLRDSAGTIAWARACQAVIVVVQRDQAKRSDVAFVVENLSLVESELAGLVLREGRSRRAAPEVDLAALGVDSSRWTDTRTSAPTAPAPPAPAKGRRRAASTRQPGTRAGANRPSTTRTPQAGAPRGTE